MAGSADVKARLRAQIAAIEKGSPAPAGESGEGARRQADAAAQGAVCPAEASGALDGGGVAHLFAGAEADEAERAFRKIERLALMREQASWALRARLARDGYAVEAVEAAVARALACGLVDDVRFAEVLVRSRLSQNRGAQGIAAELEALHIDAASVPGWPERFGIGHDSEVERALALLNRKPPRAKNERDAAFRRLVQKGYGAAVASTAARLWAESNSK